MKSFDMTTLRLLKRRKANPVGILETFTQYSKNQIREIREVGFFYMLIVYLAGSMLQ